MNIFKLFMITKSDFMHELLCTNKLQGEIIDLKTNAFDTLLQKDFNSFSFWVGDNIGIMNQVFEAACYKVACFSEWRIVLNYFIFLLRYGVNDNNLKPPVKGNKLNNNVLVEDP